MATTVQHEKDITLPKRKRERPRKCEHPSSETEQSQARRPPSRRPPIRARADVFQPSNPPPYAVLAALMPALEREFVFINSPVWCKRTW
ncbi:hypothetical protein LTR17_015748 [Elasticomyces elasticus]|nr:hypothetical protein LTR17_015748 [Elasticomyces elasticus]